MVESVAVVIVSFNARAHLLRAVRSARDACQIIVVDNASDDHSAEAVERTFPFATVLRQARNVGFGRATNCGVAHARAPFVLLLNSDAQLPDGGLTRMVGAYRRAERTFGRIGALAVRQRNESGHAQLSVGPYPSLVNEAARKLCHDALARPASARARFVGAALERVLSRPRRVAWASASCLLLRREDIRRVGGFDPRFFLYFEDVDFCLRLGRSGLPIVFDPSVCVVHAAGVSAAAAPALVKRAYRQGQMLVARRWQRPLVAASVERFAQWRGRAR